MRTSDVERKKQAEKPNTLLRGSDLPKSQSSVDITVIAVREAPDNWNAYAIIDHEPVLDGKNGFPLNKTNWNQLKYLLSGDDTDEIVGRTLRLERMMQRNPSTGLIVPSLVITGFAHGRRKQFTAPKQKAGPASRRGGKQALKPASKPMPDDEVPF